MAAIVKTKLKAARDAISKKDYEKARDASLAVLEYDPDNYNAYVEVTLRGYAVFIDRGISGMSSLVSPT